MNRYVSEMIGTMVLVLMGCGSAVFAGDMPGAVTTGAVSYTHLTLPTNSRV